MDMCVCESDRYSQLPLTIHLDSCSIDGMNLFSTDSLLESTFSSNSFLITLVSMYMRNAENKAKPTTLSVRLMCRCPLKQGIRRENKENKIGYHGSQLLPEAPPPHTHLWDLPLYPLLQLEITPLPFMKQAVALSV